MRIVGLVGSPEPGGRTRAAVRAVLAGAGVETELVELSTTSSGDVARLVADADAIVIGSPVYRATYSAIVKSMLEATERGRWGEKTAPLQGKAAATVLTGASPAHFLAMNDLRNVLTGFFAVQVLAPGLYVDHSGYVDRESLTADTAAQAGLHGAALFDLTAAVRASKALGALTPQV